jgi:hypothetical protein
MSTKKHVRTNFMSTWSIATIRKSKDRFHQKIVASLKVHPLLYKGVNLGISIRTQREAKATTMAQMKTKGHVVARLQQFALR